MEAEILSWSKQLPIVILVLYLWKESKKDREAWDAKRQAEMAAWEAARHEERKEYRTWMDGIMSISKELVLDTRKALERNTQVMAQMGVLIQTCALNGSASPITIGEDDEQGRTGILLGE